jgi:ABC-type branched-subunit amino acid transport system substrate-binding protein
MFKTPQHDQHMATAIAAHMADRGIKTVAFIGFNDAYGEGWYQEFTKYADTYKLKIVANERYGRADTSVTGQVLKIMAAKPDAVLVAGSGTPAAMPQVGLKERGYAGKFYQTHGVANNDFLRVGGKNVEGTYLPAGPMLVAAQLPDNNPIKKPSLMYIAKYEAAHGKGSVATFGGHAWDAGLLLQNAVPAALKKAQTGHQGVSCRLARCARSHKGSGWSAWRIQHVAPAIIWVSISAPVSWCRSTRGPGSSTSRFCGYRNKDEKGESGNASGSRCFPEGRIRDGSAMV